MYASVDDMIAQFGLTEMIRLTTPDGEPMETVQTDKVESALNYASSLIDSYLRKRYAVPLDLVPSEITRATKMIARYELQIGEQKTVSEEARLARKDTVAWLSDVSLGKVELDLQLVDTGDNSYAQVCTRPAVFQ